MNGTRMRLLGGKCAEKVMERMACEFVRVSLRVLGIPRQFESGKNLVGPRVASLPVTIPKQSCGSAFSSQESETAFLKEPGSIRKDFARPFGLEQAAIGEVTKRFAQFILPKLE